MASLQPHPDLRYKRTETALMCEFEGQVIAFAFLIDGGRWELSPIEGDPSMYPDRDAVWEAMRLWTRRYAWARTPVH